MVSTVLNMLTGNTEFLRNGGGEFGTVPVMDTIAPSFQWSDLARRSGDVGAALDDFGEVTVVRGAQTLRLGPPPSRDITTIVRDMCGLLSALVASDTPHQVTRVLEAAWPWTRALPKADQIALAAEVGPVAEMCESLGSYKALIDVIADWRRTARAWAEDGAAPIVVPKPVGSEVSRPET